MSVKIALAGNPNCGKTTLFNALTGANQFVGNWPGVTVEKKEGRLKGHRDVVIIGSKSFIAADFLFQIPDIFFLLILIPAPGKKVAVCTFFYAKRNMNIQAQIFFHHFTPGIYLSSSFNTLIKAFCGISTFPIWRILFFPSFCFSSSFRLREMSPP